MIIASTKERILKFLEYKGITQPVFLKETGIKRGFLDGDKLKSSVSDVFIAIIIASYPDLSLTWLITGEGSMLKTPSPPNTAIQATLVAKTGVKEVIAEQAAPQDPTTDDHAPNVTNMITDLRDHISTLKCAIDVQKESITGYRETISELRIRVQELTDEVAKKEEEQAMMCEACPYATEDALIVSSPSTPSTHTPTSQRPKTTQAPLTGKQ